jgi:SpoVK/Ycf46/Vps4 family AAA+-type ATPase
MLARAAAAEMMHVATFFHVRPGDVMNKYYGESQRRVQALEELVRESSPAVVFLDEVDTLLGSRDRGGGAQHHQATTNALLEWMDGFGTGSERIFFLGATNRPEAIDEAALRRFGEFAEVGEPSQDARLALVQHLVNTAAANEHQADLSEADMTVVAERTEGFSLADVDRLVRRAYLEVLRQLDPEEVPNLMPWEVPPLKMQHFDIALADSASTSALHTAFKKNASSRRQL